MEEHMNEGIRENEKLAVNKKPRRRSRRLMAVSGIALAAVIVAVAVFVPVALRGGALPGLLGGDEAGKPAPVTGKPLTVKDYLPVWQAFDEAGYPDAMEEGYDRSVRQYSPTAGDGVIMYDAAPAPVAAAESDSAAPAIKEAAPAATLSDSAAGDAVGGSPVFSDTNIQVEGVAEADIIKTDGKYIYTLNNKHLTIMEANNGKPKVVSQLKQANDRGSQYFNMYINGSTLVAIRNGFHELTWEELPTEPAITDGGLKEPEATEGGIDEEPATDGAVDEDEVTQPAVTGGGVSDGGITGGAVTGNAVYENNPVDMTITNGGITVAAAGEGDLVVETYGDGEAKTEKEADSGKPGLTIFTPVRSGDSMMVNTYRDTIVDVFDISDPAKPVKTVSMGQSGSYNDSRMIGAILYLISDYTVPWGSDVVQRRPATYVPLFSRDGEPVISNPDEIEILPGREGVHYTVVTGIDTEGKGGFVSKKSAMGRCDTVYCGTDSLYLTSSKFNSKVEERGKFSIQTESDATSITRISLDKGRIAVEANGEVPGSPLNQFSMDEKDGVLRIVTQSYVAKYPFYRDDREHDWDDLSYMDQQIWESMYSSSQSTGLYTLNADLDILGKITSIAEEENVHSCRFIGDIAYFVTFMQTDPLFSVDLKDPKNPKMLGALHIPGFSDYLHPFADGRLFGFGNDADEETGQALDLKLSMFDNSKPSDVKEIKTKIIKGEGYSEASWDHKAILVDSGKSLVAFPAEDSYYIYSWDEDKGFVEKTKVTVRGESYDYYGWMRGLFIGNYFYVLTPRNIVALDIDNGFVQTGALRYDSGAEAANGDTIIYVDYLIDRGGLMTPPVFIE